ncbi:MAG: TolB-like 6-bladed beta-propeller domain-containing protein [Bacteroidales bacterium]|jgi:hypothetical protein|nr:TolB-like 6-bladed beta-propeller domain-containing protein [Bacteroidales bacterium]
MKKNNYLYWIILLIILLGNISCKEVIEKKFPNTKEVKANEVRINEIIKFSNIYKLKDYVVIRDGHENASVFFYVYKYPEFKLLYSFANKGNGPNEYLMPTVFKNTPDNLFSFRDHWKDVWVSYLLTDTAGIVIRTNDIKPIDNRFMWEINQVTDSLFLLKSQDAKWSRRELWNLYSKNILDSIPNTFNLKKELGKNYYAIFEDFWITSKNEHFALAYYFMDLIEIGSVKNQKIILEKSIGIKTPPDFHLYGPGKPGGKYEYNFLNNIVYYENVVCGNKYIYALYAKVPFGELKNVHSSIIEIYSWDGEAVALLKLDKSISDFFVDEDLKMIYGFDIDNSEDFLYEYSYE